MNSIKECAVVNASPLICLAKAGMIDLLLSTFDDVTIPKRVVEEIAVGPKNDPARVFVGRGEGFAVAPDEVVDDTIREWDLGAGESAVLNHALLHPSSVAIIDDAAARRFARTLNVNYCGSLGVIVKAYKCGQVKDLVKALSALKEAGLYVSQDVLRRMEDIA